MPDPMADKSEMASDGSKCELYYIPDKVYSITVNPTDEFQYFKKPNRLDKFVDTVSEYFRGDDDYVEYKLYVELSEPRGCLVGHRGARLHLHGIFKLKSNKAVRHFLLFTLSKWLSLGMIDIDVCNDSMVWDTYCKKQQSIMRVRPWSNSSHVKKIEKLEYFPKMPTTNNLDISVDGGEGFKIN